MSYRNPTQVVDTQTGQAYADLQKTIAGSFGNYAKSYEAANIRRRKEEKENQKKLLEKRNKILSEENTQLKDFGNLEKTFPTINMDNLYGIIEDNADIKMKELPTPLDQKTSASYDRAGTKFRVSTTNLMSHQQEYIDAGGSFTLVSGILNTKPIPFAIADATTSGAIDTFVKIVSLEMPRNTRINVVNPTVLAEAWDVYGEMMPGFQPVPGSLVGKAFERSVDGFLNGEVLLVDA